MIDITLRTDGFYVDSFYQADSYNNRIIIGTNAERLAKRMFVTHKHAVKKDLRKYNNLIELATDGIERSITHETLHVVLFRIDGWDACRFLDRIDENYEISRISKVSETQDSLPSANQTSIQEA